MGPKARNDVVPQARNDVVPQARNDVIPQARNDVIPPGFAPDFALGASVKNSLRFLFGYVGASRGAMDTVGFYCACVCVCFFGVYYR